MSSAGMIARRRRPHPNAGGASSTAAICAALVRHGGERKRLDTFRYDLDGTTIDAFDLMTSFPVLSAGYRQCGVITDGDAWAFSNPEERTHELHDATIGITHSVHGLRDHLRSMTFKPTKPRQTKIPKIKFSPDIDPRSLLGRRPEDVIDPKCIGKTRPLTIADRNQRAAGKGAVNCLNAFMHQRFANNVIGCRPSIGIAEILHALCDAIRATRRTWVLAVDIQGFFDNVPGTNALSLARNTIGYDPQSPLGWLIEKAILGRGFYDMPDALPQGNPLSPLLANIYAAEAIDAVVAPRWPMMRYVDDVLVLCDSYADAQAALATIKLAAAPMGLSLADDKTICLDLRDPDAALTYLGLDITIDDDLSFHYHLRDTSIVSLWHQLVTAVAEPSTTMSSLDHLTLLLQRRHSIWTGWMHAFGSAEWTPEQVIAVESIAAALLPGADAITEAWREAWWRTQGAELARRTAAVQHYTNCFAWNGIRVTMDADGGITFNPEPLQSFRNRVTSKHAKRGSIPLRWFSRGRNAMRPQWTAPKQYLRKPSLFARLTQADFCEAYGDAIPSCGDDVPVCLGPGAAGDGVNLGVIVM